MSSERHTLIAFMSSLAAIVVLVGLGCLMAAYGKSVEAVGIGGAVTGLIGVIGTWRPRTGGVSDQTAQTMADKIPPASTSTGDPT